MRKQQSGVIGIGVMGKNLAINAESRGLSVSVYDRYAATTDELLTETIEKNIKGTYSIEEFVNSLQYLRKRIMKLGNT